LGWEGSSGCGSIALSTSTSGMPLTAKEAEGHVVIGIILA
jgi:hypothetical protein